MKHFLPYLLCSAISLLPLRSFAQTELDDENDFRTRITLGLDKKIIKGLHVTAEEEFRFQDGSSAIDRFQTGFGISYKVLSGLKVGASYTLLNPYSSKNSSFKNPRHRISLDLTGSLKSGFWTFSIKERIQMTHRSGDFNQYQNTANAWVMKTRAGIKYRGFDFWKPYAFAEIRNTLNAPAIAATYNSATDTYYTDSGTEEGDPGWFISGWNNMYINRLRGALGCELNLSKKHGLDFYLLLDYYTDKSVDANSSGTKLKSYTVQHGLNTTLGVGYSYSF